MKVEELCSRTDLPCQGSVLLQPDCRVCNIILSGCCSSKVLGWGWESSQESGMGACHWPRSQPCILALLSLSLWMQEQV